MCAGEVGLEGEMRKRVSRWWCWVRKGGGDFVGKNEATSESCVCGGGVGGWVGVGLGVERGVATITAKCCQG